MDFFRKILARLWRCGGDLNVVSVINLPKAVFEKCGPAAKTCASFRNASDAPLIVSEF
ncbi:MAG: hypothetical protein AB3N19_03080 [Ruegeria sp.]